MIYKIDNGYKGCCRCELSVLTGGECRGIWLPEDEGETEEDAEESEDVLTLSDLNCFVKVD